MKFMNSIKGWLTDDPDDPNVDEPTFEDEQRDYSNNDKVSTNYNLILASPDEFEDSTNLADKLKYGNALIVDLSKLSKNDSQRLIDFLAGVLMAKNGMMKKISSDILVCTPETVKMLSE